MNSELVAALLLDSGHREKDVGLHSCVLHVCARLSCCGNEELLRQPIVSLRVQ